MQLSFIKLALLFFPVLLLTGNDNWKVQSSELTFAIKYAGSTIKGTMGGLIAEIKFDPSKPEDAIIKASIDAKTIKTNVNLHNRDIRNNYLEADKYPRVTMQSTKIEKTGPISYMGTFKLNLKNVTKEIKIPFLFMKTPEKTEFKADFSLNRLEYGVGEKKLGLSDDVEVSIIVNVSENVVSAKEQ